MSVLSPTPQPPHQNNRVDLAQKRAMGVFVLRLKSGQIPTVNPKSKLWFQVKMICSQLISGQIQTLTSRLWSTVGCIICLCWEDLRSLSPVCHLTVFHVSQSPSSASKITCLCVFEGQSFQPLEGGPRDILRIDFHGAHLLVPCCDHPHKTGKPVYVKPGCRLIQKQL